MNLISTIPLLYQLFTAYQPAINSHILEPKTIINPVPTEQIINITPAPIPAKNIGGISTTLKIALLGDSMIETLKNDIITKSLKSYFPYVNFEIINAGLPAQTIKAAKNKLLADIIPQKPNIIVIESFAYNNFGNTLEGINDQTNELLSLTNLIKEKLPDTKIIIAATISPNSISFANGTDQKFSAYEKIEKTQTIKTYLQNTINFATTQKYPLANTFELSQDQYNQGRKELIDSNDFIHPSLLGQQLFSDILAKTIYDSKLVDSLI